MIPSNGQRSVLWLPFYGIHNKVQEPFVSVDSGSWFCAFDDKAGTVRQQPAHGPNLSIQLAREPHDTCNTIEEHWWSNALLNWRDSRDNYYT